MRKLLIILGGVVVAILIVVALLSSTGGGQSSTAKSFAEAIVLKKDASSAYSYTSEGFRENTTKEELTEYVDKIKNKIPTSTKLKQISSSKVVVASNKLETYITTFSFNAQDIDWLIEVTTYVDNSGKTLVHYYTIFAASIKNGNE